MYKFLYYVSCYVIAVIGVLILTYIGGHIPIVATVILSSAFGCFYATHLVFPLARFFVRKQRDKDKNREENKEDGISNLNADWVE